MAGKRRKNRVFLGNFRPVVCAGNRIYKFAEGCLSHERLQLSMTTVLSFISVLTVLWRMWPFHGLYMVMYAVFICLFAICMIILITKCAFVNVMVAISNVMKPYADCFSNLPHDEKKETAREACRRGNVKNVRHKPEKINDAGIGGLGSGPKAEVSIKYFIEIEKGRSIYNAHYLG